MMSCSLEEKTRFTVKIIYFPCDSHFIKVGTTCAELKNVLDRVWIPNSWPQRSYQCRESHSVAERLVRGQLWLLLTQCEYREFPQKLYVDSEQGSSLFDLHNGEETDVKKKKRETLKKSRSRLLSFYNSNETVKTSENSFQALPKPWAFPVLKLNQVQL